MASNMQMNNWGGQFGGGGGMQNLQNMGGMGRMPRFSRGQGWSNQMGGPQQQPQAPPGQNGPVDSNAPYRDVYGPNGALANGGTLGSPYGMNQSNTNTWNGNGWSSNLGTPVLSSQLGGYMNRPPGGQTEPARQQWNPGPNTGMQTPYQMPGGQGPISMDPRYGGPGQPPSLDPAGNGQFNMSDFLNGTGGPPPQGGPGWNNGWGPKGPPQNQPRFSSASGVSVAPGQNQISTVGNPAGPRPRGPQGPSTQPGGSPWFRPVNNQPGKGIGPGGPTRYVPGFNPGGPAPWNPTSMGPQQQQGPYRAR